MGLVVVLSAFLALVGAVSEAGFESKAFDSADNPPTFQSMIVDCLTSNIPVTCLSIKAIMALNRAAQTDKKFEILPGVSIRRDGTITGRSANAFVENEIIHSLPSDESERSGHLIDLALDSLANFIDSHSLEVRFPRKAIDRAVQEGRTIKKKHMSALALALALKALMLLGSKMCQGGHKGGHYTEWINRSL